MQNVVWSEKVCHLTNGGDTASGTHQDVTLSYPPDPNGGMLCLEAAWGGYDQTPTQAVFIVVIGGSNGSTIVAKAPLGTCGFYIPIEIKSYPGQAISVKITDGGVGVTGYLNVKPRVDTVP